MKLFCDFVDLWNIMLHMILIELLSYEIIYEFVIAKSWVITVIYEYAVMWSIIQFHLFVWITTLELL